MSHHRRSAVGGPESLHPSVLLVEDEESIAEPFARALMRSGLRTTVHSLIVVSWVLAAVHALGAGSDAQRLWLRALVFAPTVPIAYLLVLRVLKGDRTRARTSTARHSSAVSRQVGGSVRIL
jgi:hypothetical protein